MITGDADDVDRAVAAWRTIVSADPNCFECQIEVGRAHALAGDDVAAERSWHRADALTETDARPAELLRRLYEVSGRTADAARMGARIDELASS